MTDPSPDIPWYKAYTGSTPQGRLGDGREQSLLTHVRNLSPTTPSSVATAIDSFGFSNQYLMTIGPRKATLLTSLITSRKPKIMVELGGYIGYSAVVLGAAVKAAGGEKYISIERYHHIDEVSWLRFQKMRQCLDILYKELIGICVDDEMMVLIEY
ncbi:hypothetical protein D6C76_04856 [Aureobasidium pullulans]|nr:hypothetical protein D6C76_04856 [Aureobasidium pullulans]